MLIVVFISINEFNVSFPNRLSKILGSDKHSHFAFSVLIGRWSVG